MATRVWLTAGAKISMAKMGHTVSEESRRKSSEKHKKRWTPELRAAQRRRMQQQWLDDRSKMICKDRSFQQTESFRKGLSVATQKYYDGLSPQQRKQRMSKLVSVPCRPEVRRKIAFAHLRENMSAESRKRLSLSKMGNQAFLGKRHSKEMREKLSMTRSLALANGTQKISVKGINGPFLSRKHHKQVWYRSSLERSWFEKLEKDESVISYQVEPLRVRYVWGGLRKTYNPDLLVFYTDGRKKLVEIKPEGEWLRTPRTLAKWDAARLWCVARGFRFCIWGYRGLRTRPRLKL